MEPQCPGSLDALLAGARLIFKVRLAGITASQSMEIPGRQQRMMVLIGHAGSTGKPCCRLKQISNAFT